MHVSISTLSELYAPIAEGIDAIPAIVRRELRSELPCVRELCEHVARYQGKMLRPALLLLSGEVCGGAGGEHHVLGAVVELVHIATLVHDDVLDDAEIRRRNVSVNRRWGNESAVLLGDYLISHAYHLCSSLDSQYASRLIGRTTNTVCEGELMQVAYRGRTDLDEATYYDIITRKTASLISTCCGLGAKFAGADQPTIERLERYGLSVGIAFQIADDLLDLLGDERETGKSAGRDVDMGKVTLPVIHYLANATGPERQEMVELVRCGEAGAHHRVAALLSKSDSVDYARDAARVHISTALEALSDLPVCEARQSLIAMAEFILLRRQ